MRLFGAFLPSDISMNASSYQKGSSDGIYGAGVATQQFMANLLRYGDFDEYHLFDPLRYKPANPGEAEAYFGLSESDPRLKFFQATDFEDALRRNDYLAFHEPRGPMLAPKICLRDQLGIKNVPITCVTHTLSYHRQILDFLTHLLIGARPWDSIVCPETPVLRVMQNHFNHLQTRLYEQFGLDLKYEGRLDSIPLGVNTQTYRPRDKQALRQQFGLPPDKVLLLWVGRFSHYDKMDLRPLLLAFKAALEKCSKNEAILVLAGDDTRYSYSEKVIELATELGIEKQLIILKNRPRIDFPLLYSAADVFVSPCDNIQETFGLTVLEGMAAGLPVVCSDWDGYMATVRHEKTGFRIPTYWMECDSDICTYAPVSSVLHNQFYLSQSISFDVKYMANALSLLIDNDGLRSKMGRQARQHMLETYDWKVIIHRYIELWEELYQIAASHPVTATQSPSWYRPQYFKTFEHYATTTLKPTTQVRATHPERGFPTTDEPLPWYDELNAKLDPEVIHTILSLSSGWMTTAELEHNVSRAMDISTERFRYHLLWLLKYDWLTVNVDTVGQAVRELAVDSTMSADKLDAIAAG